MSGVPPSSAGIVVDELTVVRGANEVLHRLSFEVPRGRVVGLLGPSGGGKTTLMRAIVGVQIVQSGSVRVLDLPAGSPVLRHRVGYVTQAPAVYSDLSARENLRYFAAVLNAPAGDVARVLEQVDLVADADRPVSQLSGGQQARVSLGVALLNDPEVLVLDEPTVGLDPLLREQLWGLFATLAAGGVTLLVSSHVMEEASRCERLLLLHEGRLIADETPQQLVERTGTSDVDSAFLSLVREAGPS